MMRIDTPFCASASAENARVAAPGVVTTHACASLVPTESAPAAYLSPTAAASATIA